MGNKLHQMKVRVQLLLATYAVGNQLDKIMKSNYILLATYAVGNSQSLR